MIFRDDSWTCFGCDNSFSNFAKLQQHLNNIREIVQYFCKLHNIYFENDSDHECLMEKRCGFCVHPLGEDFKLHKCFHIYAENDLKCCNICDCTYSSQYEREHLKGHGVKKRKKKVSVGRTGGKCKKCDLHFSNVKEYYQHRYKRHYKKREKTNVVCHICGKVYSSFTIGEHLKNIHAKKRNYKCVDCGKCFANKYKLDRHMIVHTNEFKHQCSICNKMFKMRYSLQVHLKMHNNKITFECYICSKTFSTKQSRDGHLKRHGSK